MKAKQIDLTYLELIAEIKWQKGFKCRKCKHKEAYQNRGNYSMKCKRCKCVESVTANTAFAGLKISLENAFGLFIIMQENYLEWYTDFEETIVLYQDGEIENYKKEKAKRKESSPRIPLRRISKWLEVRPEAAWYYLNRLAKWMPKKYWKESPAAVKWFPHYNQENKMYNALFNILFNDDEDIEEDKLFSARSLEEILELLIFKKLLKREE